MTTSPTPIYYAITANFNLPVWLQVLLGVTATTAALLLLTCLTLCCMRMCGCWTGNILGVGSLRRVHPEDGDHIGCWCCRPTGIIASRDDGSYVIQVRNNRTGSDTSTPRKVWIPHTHPVRNNNQFTQ